MSQPSSSNYDNTLNNVDLDIRSPILKKLPQIGFAVTCFITAGTFYLDNANKFVFFTFAGLIVANDVCMQIDNERRKKLIDH